MIINGLIKIDVGMAERGKDSGGGSVPTPTDNDIQSIIQINQTHTLPIASNWKNLKGHLFFIAVQTATFDNPEIVTE